METTLAKGDFCELKDNELAIVDGGSWQKVAAAVGGCVLIANALPISIAAGIGATPAGGVVAFGLCLTAGGKLLDYYSN